MKSMVGKVGSGSRFAHSWHSRTVKPTSDGVRLDVMAEVDRGGSVVDLVCQAIHCRISSQCSCWSSG